MQLLESLLAQDYVGNDETIASFLGYLTGMVDCFTIAFST